jgi:hypothetical protein
MKKEKETDEKKTALYLMCWQQKETQTHAHIMKTHKDTELTLHKVRSPFSSNIM